MYKSTCYCIMCPLDSSYSIIHTLHFAYRISSGAAPAFKSSIVSHWERQCVNRDGTKIMEKTVYSQSRALADDDGETARSAGLIALKQRPLYT